MTPDQLKRLKLLEREDLRHRLEQDREDQAALRAARIERRKARKAKRRARWKARWERWVAFWEVAGKHLKTAGVVIAGATGVATGLAGFAQTAPGRWAGHMAKRMWSFYADRDVGPPAQPPPTGAPSTALDFQKTKGRPPDGGQR